MSIVSKVSSLVPDRVFVAAIARAHRKFEPELDRIVASIRNPGDHISEIALLKSQIKDGVSRFLYEQTKRRPMVFPVVVEV